MFERSQRQLTALRALDYITLSCSKVLCKYLNPVWQHHFHLTWLRWLLALSASHLYLMKSPIHVNLGYVEKSHMGHELTSIEKNRNNSEQKGQTAKWAQGLHHFSYRVRFIHSFISTFFHLCTWSFSESQHTHIYMSPHPLTLPVQGSWG